MSHSTTDHVVDFRLHVALRRQQVIDLAEQVELREIGVGLHALEVEISPATPTFEG